jgi:hypothetical protein
MDGKGLGIIARRDTEELLEQSLHLRTFQEVPELEERVPHCQGDRRPRSRQCMGKL